VKKLAIRARSFQLCPWTPLGAQPPESQHTPHRLLFPPNLVCLDKTL